MPNTCKLSDYPLKGHGENVTFLQESNSNIIFGGSNFDKNTEVFFFQLLLQINVINSTQEFPTKRQKWLRQVNWTKIKFGQNLEKLVLII